MDPVSSANFFGPGDAVPPPPPASSWAPPRGAAPAKVPVKKAWKPIDVDQDDDDDELIISTAMPANAPRGRNTSSFRPATMPTSKGKDKEELWEDDWTTGTRSTQFTSSGAAWNAAASHPTSSSRSTAHRRPSSPPPRRPSSTFETWDDGNLTATETSPTNERFETTSDFGSGTVSGQYEIRPAWTAPKVVELRGEKGGMGGMYATSMWDFEEVADTPAGEGGKDSKYRAMGEWVTKESSMKRAEGALALTDQGQVAMKEVEQEEPKVEAQETDAAGPSSERRSSNASLGAAAARKEDDVAIDDTRTSPSPTSPPVPSSKPERVFRTITRNELSTIRPHPNAYYSRATSSWIFFIPLPAKASSSRGGPELFRTLRQAEPKQHRHGVEPPPLPAVPAELSTDSKDDDGKSNKPRLHKLVGTEGHRVVYSMDDFYPTVIPLEVLQRLAHERGKEPVAGQTKESAMLASMTVIWRYALRFALSTGTTRADERVDNQVSRWNALQGDQPRSSSQRQDVQQEDALGRSQVRSRFRSPSPAPFL